MKKRQGFPCRLLCLSTIAALEESIGTVLTIVAKQTGSSMHLAAAIAGEQRVKGTGIAVPMLRLAIGQPSIASRLPLGWLPCSMRIDAASATEMEALHLLFRDQPRKWVASLAPCR